MDDLDRINGIGKATAKRLVDAGIATFAALAALSAERAAELDVKADWIAEAARLAAETPRHENTPPSEDRDGGAGNPAGPAAIAADASGETAEPAHSDPDDAGGRGDHAADLADASAELELGQIRISVTAAAGPRRRAGFGFGPEARILTLAELGPTVEARENTLRALQADPQLSIAPVIDEAPAL